MSDLSRFSDEEIITVLSSDTDVELKKRGYDFGWYNNQSFVGAIYVLVNPAFSNLVKIGYADDVQKRLKTLNSNSGLPDPYHCYAVYKVKKRLEDLKLHSLIDTLDPSLRHSKNREFYEMDCEKAYEILSAIAQINGDEEQLTKNPFADEFFNEKEKVAKDGKISEEKKPNLKFNMLGIPVGSTLVFARDNSITCKTVDDNNHVEYEGKTYSISSLALELLLANTERTSKHGVQGSAYFLYNGELLTDIRERLGV